MESIKYFEGDALVTFVISYKHSMQFIRMHFKQTIPPIGKANSVVV